MLYPASQDTIRGLVLLWCAHCDITLKVCCPADHVAIGVGQRTLPTLPPPAADCFCPACDHAHSPPSPPCLSHEPMMLLSPPPSPPHAYKLHFYLTYSGTCRLHRARRTPLPLPRPRGPPAPPLPAPCPHDHPQVSPVWGGAAASLVVAAGCPPTPLSPQGPVCPRCQ
jgi:hypothetical protein